MRHIDKRTALSVTVVLLLALSFFSLLLPVMSANSPGTLSCDIVVKGYNLAEFGICGWVPIIAPVLLIVVIGIGLSAKAQKPLAVLLFAVNAVCTAIAFHASHSWLSGIGDITYYPGIAVYPLLFTAAAAGVLLITHDNPIQ